MSIEPGSSYSSLTLYKNGTNIWTVHGPLSSDFVAGLSMGIFTVVDFLSKGQNFTYEATEIIKITRDDDRSILIDLASNDPQYGNKLETPLGNYIIVTGANPDNYLQYNPDTGNYSWWISNYADTHLQLDNYGQFISRSRYIVCRFGSEDFIQGFISLCNASGIDFREFTLGRPFTYDNTTHKRTYYNIPGYDTAHFSVIPRIPAPISPFYIENFEDDLFAEDFN